MIIVGNKAKQQIMNNCCNEIEVIVNNPCKNGINSIECNKTNPIVNAITLALFVNNPIFLNF